ncbi:MAG: hypothetical protein ACKOXT_02315 [Actinomycetota bacterium]
MGNPEYLSELADSDEAIEKWGSAAFGEDPLLASFTLEPFSTVRPHVPFYRFFHYPDVLDLRHNGFEVDRFIPIFDSLDNARYSQAVRIHQLLHYSEGNALWNPRRAREFEFRIRASLHDFGISDVPTLLRRMLGRAFPDESLSTLSIDLLNVYFWGALAVVVRDYAWKEPQLELYADYLEYPLEVAGLLPNRNRDAA